MKVLFSTSLTKAVNNKIKTREDGAFFVIFGAVNAYNIHGTFYPSDGLKELLTSEGYQSFGSKLKRGLLKGECHHPFNEPGMTDADFLNRNLVVDNGTASHHILEVLLEETNEVEVQGKKVLEIWAWIKPTANQHGNALKADLLDDSVNVAFSIRCFSIPKMVNGIPCKFITSIMTWDWVDNPGVARSGKASTSKASLTAENAGYDVEVTAQLIDELRDKNRSSITTESADVNALIESVSRKVTQEIPVYKRW